MHLHFHRLGSQREVSKLTPYNRILNRLESFESSKTSERTFIEAIKIPLKIG